MKHLIFSDIHSNLEALEAVLASAADKPIDATICLGDFVGYGANPNECVEMIKQQPNTTAVLGNHDAALLDPREREFFNPVARAGIAHSEKEIQGDSRAYLQGLPLVLEPGEAFMAVHASPFKPDAWVYVLDPIEAADAFHALDHPVAFIGHTHFPAVHLDNGSVIPFLPGDRIQVDSDQKRLINVGSVGQPRDGDPRASYVIFDDEAGEVEIFRVEYDIDKAADKIIKAGLPPMLADRLQRGY